MTLMRSKLRLGHYSRRTEQAYVGWVIRFVRHHRLRHPAELVEQDVMAFLRHLAEERRVAAATQGQALAALLFLYREVLGRPLAGLGPIPRARAPARLPVVLTQQEVERVLAGLQGTAALVGALLYGSGMRLLECLTLRVKDVDLERGELRIRRAKGARDRVTVLARAARGPLGQHLERVRQVHLRDVAEGAGWVELPEALGRKYPNAGRSWPWQWVLPARRRYFTRPTLVH